MKQDIRLLQYLENFEETVSIFGKSTKITWEATAKLQVFKNDLPNGNIFIFKYALLSNIVPREFWNRFRRGVTDRTINFEIFIPKRETGYRREEERFSPYPIMDDWDFYNYFRQDVYTINNKFNLMVEENEWYGLFMHYMPKDCMRQFRSLSDPVQLK